MKTHRKIYAKGLGGPYLHIKRDLTYDSKINLKKSIEKSLTLQIEKTFKSQVTVHIEIVEGSIKVRIVIGALALFHFVCNYGSFRSGIDHLVNDVRNLSSSVIEHVIEDENIQENEIIYRARRLGIPGKVQRYLKKLDRLDDTTVDLEHRSVLINELKNDLTDILSVLEDERDRELVINVTPNVINEEIANNLPNPIPGQLDLGYGFNQDLPPSYRTHVNEDINQDNQYQTPPSLPESYFFRAMLPPPRNEDEE